MQFKDDSEIQHLIKGCCRKDRESQNALYRKYYAYGMSIGIRYVQSEAEAISIVNDGFLKVFNHIKKYNIDQPFKPWFRKIMINTAINHVNKQKKFKMEVSLENLKSLSQREEILSRIGYQDLMKIVQTLSTSYRTVFNMYVIDGFKHKEISKKLGISEATSKSNLSRARAKLQELVLQNLNNSNV